MDLEKEGIQISIFRQFRLPLLRQLTDALKATTPPKAAKELPLVAFSSLWLCASAHKAFRFRRGVGDFITTDEN
jgi:hypothetical protein